MKNYKPYKVQELSGTTKYYMPTENKQGEIIHKEISESEYRSYIELSKQLLKQE